MDTTKWRRILAATDFSPMGNRAVTEGHSLAETFGAELHVLHVVDNADGAATQHGASGVLEPADGAVGNRAWLAELLGETGTVRRVDSVQIGRDVAEKIVHYARHQEIDLIVVASHGRTGLAHLLLGSVAEKVIRSAPCPVLVLRSSATETTRAASI
jgi:universal stress protein A